MRARDITAEFTKAALTLETGQLVKDEYFTLFESVGALEIMDSKMDSGYLGLGETHAQALEDDYDVGRDLQPDEVLGIMDQLLFLEIGWHMGHPLSQTVFTSIYIDRLLWPVPKSLEEAQFQRESHPNPAAKTQENPLVNLVLRAYCLSQIKACDLVHARVSAEYFYEEEDFVTQLYNRNLFVEFDTQRFYPLIHNAISWLEEQTGIDAQLKNALKNRLFFRREFLAGLDQDIDVIDARSTENFDASLRLASSIESSMSLGRPVEEAFSLKIQRKLASSVPPRPMVKISPEDALAHLKRFCQDAIDVQQLLDYRGPHNLRASVWTIESRKPQPSVYIRSLLQSLLVSEMMILGSIPVKRFFYDDLEELVLPASPLLQSKNEEVEVPHDPRFQIVKHMDNFVNRAAQPFVDTFRGACLNRSRIRRTLCHSIIEWDNLQVEAEEYDVHLRTLSLEPPLVLNGGEPTFAYPLSSWAYHQKLRQLRLIIQLGFELSIYSPGEMPGMYWYLSHICSTHLAHLDRIRAFVNAASKRESATALSKKTGLGAADRKQAFERTHSLLDRLTTNIIAIDAFSLALHALYVLLARHNKLPSMDLPYSSKKLRYELRMKPFISISLPELVPFEDYEREATLEDDSDEVVLDRALRAIAEAKKSWEEMLSNGAFLLPPMVSASSNLASNGPGQGEQAYAPAIAEDWKRDSKDSLRSCIGASIAIQTVKRAMANAQERRKGDQPDEQDSQILDLNLDVEIPEIGSKTRWHDWWVVPKVTERRDVAIS